jgi:hypothetical protein
MGAQSALVIRASPREAKKVSDGSPRSAKLRPTASEHAPDAATASLAPPAIAAIPVFAPGEPASAVSLARPYIALQRKLAVGAVDDPLEREADRVAEQVMRMPERALPTRGQEALPISNIPSIAMGAAVAQRQADASADEQNLPAGAPPAITWDFDPVSDDASPAPESSDTSGVDATLQRSVDLSGIIRRQAAPAPAAPGPAPVVAQTLSWSDFPVVPNRIGGTSAQTGFTPSWRNDGTGFSVAFNPATSWSVVADQTDALLRHEQYHLNLAALIANKANAAVGTMRPAALIRAFQRTLTTHTNSYDGDTDHGQNTRLQTLWEQDIDAGVPQFPFTS